MGSPVTIPPSQVAKTVSLHRCIRALAGDVPDVLTVLILLLYLCMNKIILVM